MSSINGNRFSSGLVSKDITTKVPIVSPNDLVGEVVASISDYAKTLDSIDYVYVTNEKKQLVGVVSVRELFRNEKQQKIREIMTRNLVITHSTVGERHAAHLAIKHNIKAVPVLNKNNEFKGVLTSDTLLEILYNEHRNDMYKSAGVIAIKGKFTSILEQGIWKTFFSRIPWIIIGLIGGVASASIVDFFTDTLSKNIILAAFIPLVVYIGNAVGAQAQVLFVRDMVFHPKLNVLEYVVKQMITALMIGSVCGISIWFLVSLFWKSAYIGFAIGLAGLSAVTVSTFIAILIPYLFSVMNRDPATGSGPFATILQDILSITVYFMIVSMLI